MSKKRNLSTEEAKEATNLINSGWSWRRTAKYFKVNLPSLLKSVGLWQTSKRTLKDGREYHMERGKVIIKGVGGFEIKDLPPKT